MLSGKKAFKYIFLHRRICSPDIFNPFFRFSKSVTMKQDFYICSSSSFLVDFSKFDSCRKVATRILKRQKPKGFLFPCFKFTLPYTRKSKNARMGKGKGSFDKFVSTLNCYSPFFFLHNVSLICAARVLMQIEHKLPVSLCLFSIKKIKELTIVKKLVDIENISSNVLFSSTGAIRSI